MSSLRRDAVRVRVPATSANLGPGFDCAGLALDLCDELVAMITDDPGVLVEVSGEGAGVLPTDESHLVVRAMNAGFEWLGVRAPGFILRCTNAIPQGRGLGSSAAAIVAGVMLSRALVDDGTERMTLSDVLQLALTFESHPDNLAAAVYGGFTIAWLEDDGFADAIRMDVHPRIHPVVIFPATQVLTKAARAALPASVPFADAAFNVARASLLVTALTHDPSRLMTATQDRLHQSARETIYPESVALVERLRAAGVAAVISGAGPSILAFVDDGRDLASEGWTTLELAVAESGAREFPIPPMD